MCLMFMYVGVGIIVRYNIIIILIHYTRIIYICMLIINIHMSENGYTDYVRCKIL